LYENENVLWLLFVELLEGENKFILFILEAFPTSFGFSLSDSKLMMLMQYVGSLFIEVTTNKYCKWVSVDSWFDKSHCLCQSREVHPGIKFLKIRIKLEALIWSKFASKWEGYEVSEFTT
jgi:hypothetical protein